MYQDTHASANVYLNLAGLAEVLGIHRTDLFLVRECSVRIRAGRPTLLSALAKERAFRIVPFLKIENLSSSDVGLHKE